jgi:hypothetical protein
MCLWKKSQSNSNESDEVNFFLIYTKFRGKRLLGTDLAVQLCGVTKTPGAP